MQTFDDWLAASTLPAARDNYEVLSSLGISHHTFFRPADEIVADLVAAGIPRIGAADIVHTAKHFFTQQKERASLPMAIFWDVENVRIPNELSGEAVAQNIKQKMKPFGSLAVFNAYFEVSSVHMPSDKRSGLQLSGCHIIDTPHISRKEVADKMIIVDALLFAMQHAEKGGTLCFITGDTDYAYLLSKLQELTKFRTVLVTHHGAKDVLHMSAHSVFSWGLDILGGGGDASGSGLARGSPLVGARTMSSFLLPAAASTPTPTPTTALGTPAFSKDAVPVGPRSGGSSPAPQQQPAAKSPKRSPKRSSPPPEATAAAAGVANGDDSSEDPLNKSQSGTADGANSGNGGGNHSNHRTPNHKPKKSPQIVPLDRMPSGFPVDQLPPGTVVPNSNGSNHSNGGGGGHHASLPASHDTTQPPHSSSSGPRSNATVTTPRSGFARFPRVESFADMIPSAKDEEEDAMAMVRQVMYELQTGMNYRPLKSLVGIKLKEKNPIRFKERNARSRILDMACDPKTGFLTQVGEGGNVTLLFRADAFRPPLEENDHGDITP